ncbi:secretin receptor-like isoform X1 [Varroa destructor]|uniref:Secretin receptor n=1 Tax=Varroa destructor TaxID=109461 RepID=A0A7M7KEW4_VARDE|nr:secretin receptor-like isoform X1 [Varroa destructor]
MDSYVSSQLDNQIGQEIQGGVNMFERFLIEAMRECLELKEQEALLLEPSEANVWCSRAWDGSLCWPPMKIGEMKQERCPDLLARHDTNEFVVRTCTVSADESDFGGSSMRQSSGIERTLLINTTGDGLSDYSRCVASKTRHNEIVRLYQVHIPLVKIINRLGYSTSLILLLAAFLVFSSCRRLRSARNQLHCQLFASYVLRASVILTKDLLFVDGVGFRRDLESNQRCPWCKAFMCLFHYSILANYAWMFVEGLYLHGLVYRALHSSQHKASFGTQATLATWIGPLWIIIPWAILRSKLDNRLCWTTNESLWLLWLLQAPVCITIVLNFCLFVRIARVLLNRVVRPEVQPASTSHQYTYREWFRASLILIPLLASHYIVLLAMNLLANILPPVVEIVWFYIDALFTSFQGAFVAFLYCLGSPEVHSHLRRKLRALRSSGSFRSSNVKRDRLRPNQGQRHHWPNELDANSHPGQNSSSAIGPAGNDAPHQTHESSTGRIQLPWSEQQYKAK